MNLGELLEVGKSFEQRKGVIQKVEDGKRQLELFLEKYPFRERPELIDSLTAERIYNPGSDDYFFLWIEHKTRDLGRFLTFGQVYLNAVNKIDQFKQLLKVLVDENKSIREKIDYDCGIEGFGGDKLIIKKILYCYFSDEIIPIFKTEHLEHFCKNLGLDCKKESISKFDKNYENLSLGEKYELLNTMPLDFKNTNFPNWDNALFMWFLYDTFPPPKDKTEKTEKKTGLKPLYRFGLLFEPQSEQEVVYLFSLLHRELGFPYIVRFQEAFPDVIVLDEDREIKRIEIERFASDFRDHGHSKEDCDFIVCLGERFNRDSRRFPRDNFA